MRRVILLEGILAFTHAVLSEPDQAKMVLTRMLRQTNGKSLYDYTLTRAMCKSTLQQGVDQDPIFVAHCQMIVLQANQCQHSIALQMAIRIINDEVTSPFRVKIMQDALEDVYLRARDGEAFQTREACMLLLRVNPNHVLARMDLKRGFKRNGKLL